MNVDIAKGDLLTLRSEVYERYRQMARCPAASSETMRVCVERQIVVLWKLIGKLNRACKKAYGHDCAAYCFPREH